MNQKKIKVFLLVAIAATLSMYFINKNLDKFSTIYFEHRKHNMQVSLSSDNQVDNGENSIDGQEAFINTMYTIGGIYTKKAFQMETTRSMNFTITDYFFSDKIPNEIEANDIYVSEDLSSESDRTYLIVKLKVENPNEKDEEESIEYNFNSISVCYADENENIISPNDELSYFSNRMSDSDVETYHYIFKPNEQIETTLLYICNRNKVEKYNTYLFINNSGAFPYDEEVKEFLLDKGKKR